MHCAAGPGPESSLELCPELSDGPSTGPLVLGPMVAEGVLAVVRRGRLGGRAVAVKQARPGAEAAGALAREARVLGAVRHPHVVPLLGREGRLITVMWGVAE